MHIIFYGPEGSGKGTQAKLLAEKLQYPILTSGDLVRDAAAHDNGIIGVVCKQSLDEGKYVANSEMEVLWKWRLKEEDAKGAWIMDGFPRNIDQAKFLDDKIDKYGYKVEIVFYLNIPGEESIKRLLARNRPAYEGSNESHDSLDRIKTRLAMYQEAEKDILEYYRQKGVLIEIDASKSIEEVHKGIMSAIQKHLEQKTV